MRKYLFSMVHINTNNDTFSTVASSVVSDVTVNKAINTKKDDEWDVC